MCAESRLKQFYPGVMSCWGLQLLAWCVSRDTGKQRRTYPAFYVLPGSPIFSLVCKVGHRHIMQVLLLIARQHSLKNSYVQPG